VSQPGGATQPRTTLVGALRADPAHAGDLLLCCVLPSLADHTVRWHRHVSSQDDHSVERAAASRVRRSTAVARRDGAVTGSSFYIGMPAAMASIFCHQVLMILQVAAVHGLDPHDPARAAEILVLRGRYPDLTSATDALCKLGTSPASRGEQRQSIRETLRAEWGKLPERGRTAWSQARQRGPVGAVISVLHLVSYLVPVLGMPVWAASYARDTRHLGRRALAFYAPGAAPASDGGAGHAGAEQLATTWARLPTLPRHLLAVLAVVFGVVTAGALLILRAVLHRKAERIGLVIAGLFIATCYARLWWILRPERRRT
jgi:hypothetical protein